MSNESSREEFIKQNIVIKRYRASSMVVDGQVFTPARISCGGDARVGYYCVYRGNKDDVIKVLESVLEKMWDMKEDLEISSEEEGREGKFGLGQI